ncbi:MAG: hypothetical protein Q4C96_03100 [Planctomycetia bacterium]|nr:hypothetical protein [Planctomycetia bacterium]
MKSSQEPEKEKTQIPEKDESDFSPLLSADEVSRTIIAEFIPGRGYLATFAALIIIFMTFSFFLYNFSEKQILSSDKYILSERISDEEGNLLGFKLDKIHLKYETPDGLSTELPAWLTCDIRAYVLNTVEQFYSQNKQTPPEKYSILESRLVDDFHKALKMHPWVRRVIHIQKFYPARMEIVVEYRKPVVMAEIYDPQTKTISGALPLDPDARFLPACDIPQEYQVSLPILKGCNSPPISTRPGAFWDDPKVMAAAKLVAEFGENWKALNLHAIHPTTVMNSAELRSEIHYILETKNGSRIDFGCEETSRRTQEKIQQLLNHQKRHGILEVPQGYKFEFQNIPVQL